MSGPIVRRYGFPNFEKIFGERGLQHGVDEDKTSGQADEPTAPPDPSSSARDDARPADPPPGDRK